MCFANTGPTKAGTGCCGSPNDNVINGLAGLYGANSSVSRANGERSLSGLPVPCGVRDEAVIAIIEMPALRGGLLARRGPPIEDQNHHRYGEVKTRLTIGPRGLSSLYFPRKRKGPQLALEPLNGQGIAGYVPEPELWVRPRGIAPRENSHIVSAFAVIGDVETLAFLFDRGTQADHDVDG